MKKQITKKLFIHCIVSLLAISPIHRTLAADSEQSSKKSDKPRTIPYTGKLLSADPKAMTFQLKGKEKPRIFHISPETRIIKDGQKSSMDEMREGEIISGSAIKRENGEHDAVFVRIGPKSPSEKSKNDGKKDSLE